MKELAARRDTNPASARFWRVVNPGSKNEPGPARGYRLCPGENVLPFAQPGAPLLERAAFLTHNLWVTPYDPTERFPAGEYPNQNPGGDGLPQLDARPTATSPTADLVLWYNFGQTHVPRLEDWPVMPVPRSASCSGPTASSTPTRRSTCRRRSRDRGRDDIARFASPDPR